MIFDGFERTMLKMAAGSIILVFLIHQPTTGVILVVFSIAFISIAMMHRAERKHDERMSDHYKTRFDRWWDNDLDPAFEQWRKEQLARIKQTEEEYYKWLKKTESTTLKNQFAEFQKTK